MTNNHTNAYIFLTLTAPSLNLSPAITSHVIQELTDVEEAHIPSIMAYPPTVKQLVHALHDRGYSPSFIAQQLNISQPNVSYHLHTQLKYEYVNPYLKKYENKIQDEC